MRVIFKAIRPLSNTILCLNVQHVNSRHTYAQILDIKQLLQITQWLLMYEELYVLK